jgi:hypothetical protein
VRAIAVVCALLSIALVHPSLELQPVATIDRHFDPRDRESGRSTVAITNPIHVTVR